MMVSGIKKATKDPTRTKLESFSTQVVLLANTFSSCFNPITGIGMEIPTGTEKK